MLLWILCAITLRFAIGNPVGGETTISLPCAPESTLEPLQTHGCGNSTAKRSMCSDTCSEKTPSQCSTCPRCLLLAPPRTNEPTGYTHTPGVGYHKVYPRIVGWNEARFACNADGGYLTIINSNTEALAIARIWDMSGMPNGVTDFAWIGFHDHFAEGQFVTVLDQSLGEAGYTWWLTNEPNGGTRENCGAITRRRDSVFLLDAECNTPMGFICERPPLGQKPCCC